MLTELQPAQAAPGEQIHIIGRGGYLSYPGGGYNESYRTFELYFNGEPAGSIGCYVNRCEGDLTVPVDAPPGTHEVSAEDGSRLSLQVLEATPATTPTLTAPATPTVARPVWAGTPVPRPVAAISPDNAAQVVQLARWGKGRVREVTWSPDGRLLAVASSVGIYLYHAETLEKVHYIKTEDWVESVAFSPDGATLASGSWGGRVRLWRVSDGTLLHTLEGHTGLVSSVAFSPDGAMLASGSRDGVRLWRVSDGTLLHTLEGHTNWVNSVAFSPDGATLASGSEDGTVRLWRVSDGSLLRTLEGYTEVYSVAFSPDGATLASGSGDGTVRLWQVSDGTLLHTLEGYGESVAFSPDGATLASGSGDGTVRLWRVSDGSLLHTLEGHTRRVTSVAFSPNGATLASGSWDGTVRLWGVATD